MTNVLKAEADRKREQDRIRGMNMRIAHEDRILGMAERLGCELLHPSLCDWMYSDVFENTGYMLKQRPDRAKGEKAYLLYGGSNSNWSLYDIERLLCSIEHARKKVAAE